LHFVQIFCTAFLCNFFVVIAFACIFWQVWMKLNSKVWREDSEGQTENTEGKSLVLNKSTNSGLIGGQFTGSMSNFAINDTLFICCGITHEEPIDELDEIDSDDDRIELNAHKEFGQNLFEIHSDGYFDLTIQVEGKELKVSKFALMSSSTVFRRMLSCPNAIEAQTGIVKIEKMNYKTIEAMIQWIYLLEVENMEEVAEDLYRAADKYDVALLKKKCIKSMAKNLSPQNLPTRLILAYTYDVEVLKQWILNYLREDFRNTQCLMLSDDWINFAFESNELAKKIIVDIYA